MQKLHRYKHVIIERNDNFCKQTFRNRCLIATANGVQALTVPIERYEGAKCPMRDIRVSDHGEWRHLHWNAIVSAYGESPFFDYYADDLRPFFEINADDFRDAIRPKHPLPDPSFEPRPYYQVYAQRHGFQPNMSALDLLCNEGPEGIFYL